MSSIQWVIFVYGSYIMHCNVFYHYMHVYAWRDSKHEYWLGLCPTIPNLGYGTGYQEQLFFAPYSYIIAKPLDTKMLSMQ